MIVSALKSAINITRACRNGLAPYAENPLDLKSFVERKATVS
jgi:hypothetical protein